MRWKYKPPNDWKLRFALFPVRIGNEMVWLERYYASDWGDWIERKTPEQYEVEVKVKL